MCLCVGLYKCMQLSVEAEGVAFLGAGVPDCCEPPDGVLGTQLGSSGRVVCIFNH